MGGGGGRHCNTSDLYLSASAVTFRCTSSLQPPTMAMGCKGQALESQEGDVSLWKVPSHCPVWIPAKAVEDGKLDGNSQISILFLHSGSNPSFKRSAAKKISLPRAEQRVGEVDSPGR